MSRNVNLGEHYNPYDDKSLHDTRHEDIPPTDEREPFNAVLRHSDIVTGCRLPKNMEDYPRFIRRAVRWFAIQSVVMLAVTLIYSIYDK